MENNYLKSAKNIRHTGIQIIQYKDCYDQNIYMCVRVRELEMRWAKPQATFRQGYDTS